MIHPTTLQAAGQFGWK
uniref:Uncharacterized protein n=1 Tax=Cryptococcus bacillisporus CA1280 TaxID=1296109 RepID=A0A0D0TCS1_CRYGA|nr:hypothetical protein I312_06826 [Cryptococcus bacillisporus CA1280]